MRTHVTDQLKKLDAWVYRAERGFVVAALVVMSVVVFLDVVHRTFASEENKFVEAVAKLAGFVGMSIEKGSPQWSSLETSAPFILWAGFSALAYFGIRTATRRDPMPHTKAAAFSVVGVVATYGIILLFLRLFPSGLIWSQDLALVLTLWVGFIGASMCTHENKHLKVEAVQRFLPSGIKKYVVALSGLATTAVCLILLWLSLRYLNFHYEEYVATQGAGGVITSLDVPKWQAFAALPVSFTIMAARFAAGAVAALQGKVPDDDPVDGLLEEMAPATSRRPSEVPTEVSGAGRAAADPAPSEVPTEAVRVSSDGEGDSGPAGDPVDEAKRAAQKPAAGEIRSASEGDEEDRS